MIRQNKKTAVLGLLQREGKAQSLSDLLIGLGPKYTERSVRRWLSQLVAEDLVEKTGQKRGTLYQAIQEKSSEEEASIGFSQRSMGAIDYVRQPIFQRQPVAYNEKWLESYHPNKTMYLTGAVKRDLRKAGKRSKNEEPAGTYARHIYNRLPIDLSYNSSRLEGNTYSLLDTKRLIIEGEGVKGKLDEEKVMILNHKEAIRYLVDQAGKIEVSQNAVCTLHYLLADGLVEAKYAGKVRDHGVRIGGSTYIPFENEKVLEKQLRRICDKAALIENPYEQSFFLLVHLSYLQAFIDVNKRTARLSSNIPLVQNNLVPLSFNDIEKDDYVCAVIAIYELNDVRPLQDLFVYSYLRTCRMYNATIEAMGFDKIRVMYREERRQIIRHIVTEELTGSLMEGYINSETKSLVEEEDRENFLEDVHEDLKELGPQRIAGLGITIEQLNNWLKKYR